MATGLIALLDDIAGLAKVAAASLDDVAGQAAKAGAKAAGVVIDDAAVTPRYVVGFSPARELPIVWKIARGSLKNKLLYLLPAALLLSLFAPWAITPLLMIGGAYLCYEGTEKVYEALFPHKAHHHEAVVGAAVQDALALEDQKVAGAIKTDFILSAEIMAIALATIPESSFWGQAAILALVGVAITVVVYGGVALIVKADDAGVAMAAYGLPAAAPAGSGVPAPARGGAFGSLVRGFGRGLVVGMPVFLKILSVIGTAAMIWVGGGILIHGLEEYGFAALGHGLHDLALAVGHAVPAVGGALEWIVTAAGSGLVGLIVGAALIPLTQFVLAPALSRLFGRRGSHAEHAS